MCLIHWLFKNEVKPSIQTIHVEKVVGECPICFHDIITQKNIMALPCGHLFHEKCITSWIKINRVCPICYYPI